MELDDKRDALIRPVAAAEAEPCPRKHCWLVYRAQTPRLRSVDSFLLERGRPLTSIMTGSRSNRKMMRNRETKPDVGAGRRSLAKAEDAIDATKADLGVLKSEAELDYLVPKVATKE